VTGRRYDEVVNPPRVVPVETPWPPVGAELSALRSVDVTRASSILVLTFGLYQALLGSCRVGAWPRP